VTNFESYLQPYPNYFSLVDDIKWFAQNNVAGLFNQGASWCPGGELVELKNYLQGRLMMDASLDAALLTHSFLVNYCKLEITTASTIFRLHHARLTRSLTCRWRRDCTLRVCVHDRAT
jgi:hypothetical protein